MTNAATDEPCACLRGVASCFCGTATSRASRPRVGSRRFIRPRIVREECKASPGAKALLEGWSRDVDRRQIGFLWRSRSERKVAHYRLGDSADVISDPQAQSHTRCGKFRRDIGCCHNAACRTSSSARTDGFRERTTPSGGRTGSTTRRAHDFRSARGVDTEHAMPSDDAAAYCRRSASAQLRDDLRE